MVKYKNVIINFHNFHNFCNLLFYINYFLFNIKNFYLHRGGIEPPAFGWKPKMLPLHQRCSINISIDNIINLFN